MINTEEICRKRLRYRSWHRGCKETDLLLGRFADEKLAVLPPVQLAAYERLLEESDADIWDWINGHDAPEEYAELLESLKCLVPGA
ncbi:MAG: succinate dehydrogenase assembly factor 2 [Pseudomonadota bacterium]|nr:succinate dehydrogenase assembly factor 2 [Pseudomonadota bacterium]MDE3036883.1 succinate dehydrogenase assembly factor 2 [Pseudomonadota bacterium]